MALCLPDPESLSVRRCTQVGGPLCRPLAVCVREFTECGCYGSDGGRVFRPRPACPRTGVEAGHFRGLGSLSESCTRYLACHEQTTGTGAAAD